MRTLLQSILLALCLQKSIKAFENCTKIQEFQGLYQRCICDTGHDAWCPGGLFHDLETKVRFHVQPDALQVVCHDIDESQLQSFFSGISLGSTIENVVFNGCEIPVNGSYNDYFQAMNNKTGIQELRIFGNYVHECNSDIEYSLSLIHI